MDNFTKAYIECALWSSRDDHSQPLDEGHSVADIAAETLAGMQSDCASFQEQNAPALGMWYAEAGESEERAGHDFWLTRNGHGAGFWDRWTNGKWQEKLGRKLTDAAHVYGESNLHVGDDGKIYA